MRRPFLSFIFLALLLGGLVLAQEAAPKLSFGSVQPDRGASVSPGESVTFDLYFFVDEAYGTRTAHITITPTLVPQDWVVSVDPPVHPVTLNISGVITTGSENTYADPRPLLTELPNVSESGIYYIESPSGLGYLQARKVQITVNVPSNAEYGKTYDLSFTGGAQYYGAAGSVAFTQSRGFNYKVTVTTPTYIEQVVTEPIVNETESVEPATENVTAEQTSPVVAASASQSGFSTEQVLIIVVVAVVAVFAITKLPGMTGSKKN